MPRAIRAAGRLRVKLLSEQDFCGVVGVPCGEESFVFDSEFFGFVVLHPAQSEAADRAEVRIAVAFADSCD